MPQMAVHDDSDLQRFTLYRNNEPVGFATYHTENSNVVVPHVETFPQFRGNGFAATLMEGMLAILRTEGRTIVPICSFAAAHIRSNPRHHDLLGER